ncbi:MAG: sigma-70 family RNA polymerase sigma factor [Candidatus Hydrogenedentes bacterium]|nr:sigma-70 family RNA polymerase sigma factor [Candidatus Hydrogenedentota bacterium]
MLGIARNNDVDLVRRTLSGQRDAFGLLVDRYLRFAYAIAYARAHSRNDADDVVQDSFLTAYQQLNTLREPARFSAWLATIIRRMSGKSNQRARLAESANQHAVIENEEIHPDYEREELRTLIRAEVQALNDSDREVILLCYFAGKSAGEIAAALETTPAAIRKRLQRAREKLGERLLGAIASEKEPDVLQTRQIMGAIAATTAAWESATSLTTATATTSIGGALAMKIVAFFASIAALTGGIAAYQSSGTLADQAPNSALVESATTNTGKTDAVPESPTAKLLAPAATQTEPADEQPAIEPVPPQVKLAAADTTSAPSSAPKPQRFMGGGNAQHTNYWDVPSIVEEPDIAWQVPLPTGGGINVNSQPVVDAAGNIYIDYRVDSSTGRKQIMASFTPTGSLRWTSPGVESNRSQSIPAFLPSGDLVHMYRDGSIRAHDTSNGREKWTVPVFETLDSNLGPTAGPTIDSNGNIYSGGRWTDNVFLKISPAGSVLWKTRVPDGDKAMGAGASSAALSIDEKTVYIGWDEKVPSGSGGVYALDAETGEIRWQFRDSETVLFKAAWAAPTVGPDGTIYQQDAASGIVYALKDNGDTVSVKWTYSPASPGDAPRMLALDSEALYFGTLGQGDDRGVVGALNFNNGDPIWLHVFPEGKEIGTPNVTREAVYVTVQEFGLAALEKRTGTLLWEKKQIRQGAEAGETVALGADGTIYWAVTATIDHPENCVLMALKKP